jgi:hypothetical protein
MRKHGGGGWLAPSAPILALSGSLCSPAPPRAGEDKGTSRGIGAEQNHHSFPRAFVYKNRVGHISVRHMCADGELSKPSPSFGCLKLRPMMSTKSLRSIFASGSKE